MEEAYGQDKIKGNSQAGVNQLERQSLVTCAVIIAAIKIARSSPL
jgi:hypothetical protein